MQRKRAKANLVSPKGTGKKKIREMGLDCTRHLFQIMFLILKLTAWVQYYLKKFIMMGNCFNNHSFPLNRRN